MHWSYCSLAVSHRNIHHTILYHSIRNSLSLLTRAVCRTWWVTFWGLPKGILVAVHNVENLHNIQETHTVSMISLTHLPLVPHICIIESGQHWFRWWLVAYSAPSHYLNQYWVIVNWTLWNNLQWILLKIQNFSFTKMHLKISSAKSWPFCPGGDELIMSHNPIPIIPANKSLQNIAEELYEISWSQVSSFGERFIVSSKLHLTHWGWVTHICISRITNIGSDNGLSPGRRRSIIWTNAEILLIEPFGTNFSEIFMAIHIFSFKKMHLNMSGKWRPFCVGLNVFNTLRLRQDYCQFAHDIFKDIFFNENILISLRFVPNCPIGNMSTLV